MSDSPSTAPGSTAPASPADLDSQARLASPARRRNRPRRRRALIGALSALLALGLAGWIAFQLSPWPSALAIRWMFDREAVRVSDELIKHLPDPAVSERLDVAYRPGDPDAKLDVFRPAGASGALPTVVWIHGGAWVSGDKSQIANYLRILAARGYTVVGINYSLAPGANYPEPLRQGAAALGYLREHAGELGVDPARMVLAGDSAGAQMAAQLAAAITDPGYARRLDIDVPVLATDLRATLLACGAYDIEAAGIDGAFGGFLRSVLWSYTGTKDYADDPALETASVAKHLSPAFPPTFVTAGNADPLLSQSTLLISRLGELGVKNTALFYPAEHEPALGHEYQFDLDTEPGRAALEDMVGFLGEHTR